MCNSRLLLNDVPVFHENLFKIRCGRVISGIKRQIFFAFSVLLQRVTCSVGELNFSKDFMNERRRIAYVTESLLKILFVFIKILLY